MKKMKRVGVVLLAMIMSLMISAPAFAAENFTVHVKAPSAWATPDLWAWNVDDGTNAFAAWPGQPLTVDETNAGWFYYEVPTFVTAIIVNDGGMGSQTADTPVEGKELWATVADDFTVTVAYEAPEGYVVAAADTAEATTEDAAATEATTEAATTEAAPKTGAVATSGLWLGMAALSGVGFIAAKRKKVA